MEYSLRFVVVLLIYGITHKAVVTQTNETTVNTTTVLSPIYQTTADTTSAPTLTNITTTDTTTAQTLTNITTADTITAQTPTNITTANTTVSTLTNITTANTTASTPSNITIANTTFSTLTNITTANTTFSTPTNKTITNTTALTPTNITIANTTFSTLTNITTANTTFSTPTNITITNTTAPTPTKRTTANTIFFFIPSNITTVSTTTPTTIIQLSYSLTIMEEFDAALNNQSSDKYITYNRTIQSSIDQSYRIVQGYQPNSATVTGFRAGSVIADFTIKSTAAYPDLQLANKQLVQVLRSNGFIVNDNAVFQNVKGGLYKNSGNIYPGSSLTLTCTLLPTNGITWTLNRNQLSQSNKYTMNNTGLIVNDVVPSDSGEYACSTIINSMPNINYQFITIQPYPNIQVTSDKVVPCENTTIPLQCCFQGIYGVSLYVNSRVCSQSSTVSAGSSSCLSCNYDSKKQDCQTVDLNIQVTCQLTSPMNGNSYPASSTIRITNTAFNCYNDAFGAGNVSAIQTINCTGDFAGFQVAQCSSHGWNIIENNCVLRAIQQFKDEAKNLQVGDIKTFMDRFSGNVTSLTENITDSTATIIAVVDVLTIVSNLSLTTSIDQPIMEDVLNTTNAVGSDGALDSWLQINNNNASMNASSELLKSTENFGSRLPNTSFNIKIGSTSLNKTNITTTSFLEEFGINLTTQISIPEITPPTFITVIVSPAFNNILPVRNLTYNDSSQTDTKINGDIVMIKANSRINNISLSFDVINKALGNPQCVFWNFSLLNGVGGWDSTGCQLKLLGNETERYTCECNHTTSFSILMSPFNLDNLALNYITYIGVGISMGSLVLCLIIEIIIWKSVTGNDTSFMRHVAIVNIAVSLLIANICFISGTAVVKLEGPCSTATFFMHFFYLALFFWMFLSALLLLYRTLMVFSRMTRGAMMAIGFTVGYGAPLIIAVVTVASTAGGKGYIQQGYNCWLNWNKTKALLAFVIPALTIVAINFLVLIVVLCKILRRGVNASVQPDEKHPLVVIAKCVAILTPLFGLTWGFGIGTLVSNNLGVHGVFAFFNSLQGFFILLFGTLLDSKVREALAGKFSLRNLSSNRTRSTSAGPSSSSGINFIQRLRRRNVYNVSNG